MSGERPVGHSPDGSRATQPAREAGGEPFAAGSIAGRPAPADRPGAPPAAILFDLDDTLFPEHDFVDGGFRAVAHFLAPRLGRPARELAARLWALHERDGRGHLFDTLLAEHGVAGEPDLVAACLLVYRTHEPRLAPFPGVASTLVALRAAGVRTGVVSDGNPDVQRRKLAALGELGSMFEVTVLTGDLAPNQVKPSPVPFRVACHLLDLPPDRCAYIGNDPRKDFAGARAAGLRTIRTGRVPDEGGGPAGAVVMAEDADVVLATLAELASLLTVDPGRAAGPDPDADTG